MPTLNEIRIEQEAFERERGWDKNPATVDDLLAKLDEEVAELRKAIQSGASTSAIMEEFADVTIVKAMLAGRLEINEDRAYEDKYKMMRARPVSWNPADKVRTKQLSIRTELPIVISDYGKCIRCNYSENRTVTVYHRRFSPSKFSGIMFLGEGPGKTEAEEGEPFIGDAGGVFEGILHFLGLERKQVYITNTVKCRVSPPGVKDEPPSEENQEICRWWFDEEVSILQPKAIVTLGNVATRFVLGEVGGVTSIAGRLFHYAKTIPTIPLMHPASILYTPTKEVAYKEHLKVLKTHLESLNLL